MKINPIELKQIIKEEATRLKRRMMLESEKAAILKQLQEMEACDLEETELDEANMFQRIGQKVGQAMGTRWTPEQAAKEAQRYVKGAPQRAQQLGIDVPTFMQALADFMAVNGGLAVLDGAGQNAQWDPQTKSFKKLATKLGGPGGNVMGEEAL